MESVLFFLNCKQDRSSAKKWAQIVTTRAESENAISILYRVTALSGLMAAKESNLQDVHMALRKLDSLVASEHDLPWGDEVCFLEACMNLSQEVQQDAAALAVRTAPHIENFEYRKRAQIVAESQCPDFEN